jgi:hypothetical protein
MNEANFKHLEQELGIKLPAAYRKIVSKYPDELREWPAPEDKSAGKPGEDFLLDVAEILKANKQGRKRLRKKFPPKGFIVGRAGRGNLWMIDTASSKPAVHLLFDDIILDGIDSLAELFERVKAEHKQAWDKVRKKERAGAKATLTPEDLIAEGRRLARPAVALYDEGAKYAAVWGGTGVVSAGKGEWRHWISIDTSYLPDNPRKLKGVLSVYDCLADNEQFGKVKIVHDAKARLPKKTDGTRLFAKRFDCLPDVDALFKFGAKPIQAWIKATSWDGSSNESYKISPVKEYLDVVHAEHPFMAHDGAYAMLGGWSWCFTWCYSIDEPYPWHLFKKALVVLTIAESEPWLEVFDDGKKFVTFSRIT